MKIILFGSDVFSITGIKALVENKLHILAIFTNNDAVAYEKIKIISSLYNIPLYNIDNANYSHTLNIIESYEPDIILTCNYNKRLQADILSLAKKYVINISTSHDYQDISSHSIQEIYLKHYDTVGITTSLISAQTNNSYIVSQIKVSINENDHIYDVILKLLEEYPYFIIKSFNNLMNINMSAINHEYKHENTLICKEYSNIILESDNIVSALDKIKAFSFPYQGARYKDYVIWKTPTYNNNSNDDFIEMQLQDGNLLIPKQNIESYEVNINTTYINESIQACLIYNNYLLSLYIEAIHAGNELFYTNTYEYSLDYDNFDLGYYISNTILLLKFYDNFIKCYYYGYSYDDIASSLDIIKYTPLYHNFIIEIQYKNTNDFSENLLLNRGFRKYGTIIKYQNNAPIQVDDIDTEYITNATTADIEQILELQHSIFDKYIERHLSKEQLYTFIENNNVVVYKQDNNTIAGCFIFHTKGKFSYLDYIFVNKIYQKSGIGHKLLKSFININKGKKLELWVRDNNIKAINLYKRYGFKESVLKSDIYLFTK